MELTESQKRHLEYLASATGPVYRVGGFKVSVFTKLSILGLARVVHGGVVITDAGRQALAQ